MVGVYATQGAFAAFRSDGRVVTWGSLTFGGDSRRVARQLESGVTKVFAALAAFAVKKSDGTVITVSYIIKALTS